MTARMVSFALNSLDPAAYDGWDGRLSGCWKDSDLMMKLAGDAGFKVSQAFRDADATGAALKAVLEEQASEMLPGDTFMLCFSGHGVQLPAVGDDPEPDGLDEAICLWGSTFLDDEINQCFAGFQAGVRVIAIFDACHSGTLGRDRTAVQNAMRHMDQDRGKAIQASVITISGCDDVQTSADTRAGGLMTVTLVRAWADGAFQGNWRQFHRAVKRYMPKRQQPYFDLLGQIDEAWLRERPFSV